MTDSLPASILSLPPQCYLGRQPILDAAQNIVAYELLFRSGQSAAASVTDDRMATSNVIVNTICQLGMELVLDKRDGFINVSREMLMSDTLELLPPDRVVLEILETVEIDAEVVQRCRTLKACGFRLALDDFEYSPAYDALFELVSIVKFDVMLSSPAEIEQTLRILKPWAHIRLLAEKVEDRAQFEQCRDWGFHLYQGYFFAKPVILTGKKVHPNHVVLMRVIAQLASDAEINEIEATFKESPTLTLGLLRLVNSVGMGLGRKVASLQQAIVVLGRLQLQRWVQLLLYAQEGATSPSPVMQMAAMRAKFMELLSQHCPERTCSAEALTDQAFMVGMLSLVDAVVGIPLEDIFPQLGLADEVGNAVLRREGDLGRLLELIEHLENDRLAEAASTLGALEFSSDLINQANIEAMQWAANLEG